VIGGCAALMILIYGMIHPLHRPNVPTLVMTTDIS